jgi:hypothetical protein
VNFHSKGCQSLRSSLEGQQSFLDSGQRGEVVGGKDFALDDGEVDLDLIEPTGMNRTMHDKQSWKFLLQPGNASCPAMRGAIVVMSKNSNGISGNAGRAE